MRSSNQSKASRISPRSDANSFATWACGAGDVVFAITEGGETSFVIGTAWEGVEAGAKVYFVYNNPDDILCRARRTQPRSHRGRAH